MSRYRIVLTLVIVLAALMTVVTAAGAQAAGGAAQDPAAPDPAAAAPGDPAEPGAGGEPDLTGCDPFAEIDPAHFGDPTRIDNELFPLTPGTRRVYEGRANRGGGPLPHTVTFTVTDVTKVIDGIRAVAVWDVDSSDGEIQEEELSFFAQDDDGNVWNLGEYPEEFENGEFVGAPNTWFSGIDDAVGGIHMLGDPAVGDAYLQGDSPSIDFLDCAEVTEIGGSATVPVGSFDDTLTTTERSPLDPASGEQTKTHARGVGIVSIGAVDDPEGETLVLTELSELDEADRTEATEAALRLDARGFENSDVFAQTEPAEIGTPDDKGDDEDHGDDDDHGDKDHGDKDHGDRGDDEHGDRGGHGHGDRGDGGGRHEEV